MGVFDFIKNTFSKIYDGVKWGANKVLDVGQAVRNGLGSAFDTVKRIPVLGALAEGLANAKIPIINTSLSDIAGHANNLLNTGEKIASDIGLRRIEA